MFDCKRSYRSLVQGVVSVLLFAGMSSGLAETVTVGDFVGLTNAITVANASGGGVIQLLPGIYDLSGYMVSNKNNSASHLYLKDNVSLVGLNEQGVENVLEEAGNVKLIGDGTMRGIYCDNNSSIFVKGLTITGCGTNNTGNASGGIVYKGNVSNCIATNNVTYGGVFFIESNVEKCEIRHNVFDVRNGSRGAIGSSSNFTDCNIISNKLLHVGDSPRYVLVKGKIVRSKVFATETTCALLMQMTCEESFLGGSPKANIDQSVCTDCVILEAKEVMNSYVTNCIVAKMDGWRVVVENSTAKNTLFYSGHATERNNKNYGSGMITGSILENCTIVGMRSTSTHGAIGNKCQLENCLLAENRNCLKGDFQISDQVEILPTASYSMWEKEEVGYDLGAHNVGAVEDPCFVGTEEWDALGMGWDFESACRPEFFTKNPYRITRKSPARDKGNPSTIPLAVDLAGNRRIVDGCIDIGAFESLPSTQTILIVR